MTQRANIPIYGTIYNIYILLKLKKDVIEKLLNIDLKIFFGHPKNPSVETYLGLHVLVHYICTFIHYNILLHSTICQYTRIKPMEKWLK